MIELEFMSRQKTNFIHIVHLDNDYRSYEEVYYEAKCKGKFDTGYHFYIDRLGKVSEDRPTHAVADPELINSETSIYILVSTGPKKKLTDAQYVALQELLGVLQVEYKHPKIIRS